MNPQPLNYGTSRQRKFSWPKVILIGILAVAAIFFGLELLNRAMVQYFNEHGSP